MYTKYKNKPEFDFAFPYKKNKALQHHCIVMKKYLKYKMKYLKLKNSIQKK